MIGIVTLNTEFLRLMGDIVNAKSFRSEVIYDSVDLAKVSNVGINKKPDNKIVAGFIKSVRNLTELGTISLSRFSSILQ